VRDILAAARLLQPRWDHAYALELADDFSLPLGRRVSKLSRGMRSALGIVVGLASRAPITLFDEPFLGLDAPSRQLFYERLLTDYSIRPRTVILSTHLIDEVANLLERVIVVDQGRVAIDADAESLRGAASKVRGAASHVASLTAGRRVVQSQALGSRLSAVVLGRMGEEDRRLAADLRVDVVPLSMQELVVLATSGGLRGYEGSGKPWDLVPEGATR
jgi:ABC-2 type transport system ATP-binding protein